MIQNYYDGQSFMVRKDLNPKSAMELNGTAICVIVGAAAGVVRSEFDRVVEFLNDAQEKV